jgi:hypothetical protein
VTTIDSPDEMAIIAALFFVVFALNVLPAFAPPTWMTLSFVGLTIPSVNIIAIAGVGAAAATLGRIALAKLSHGIIRHRLLGEPARLNIDAIKQGIEGRKALTSIAFMAFALSPLPSNYLFIAYGLSSSPIMLLAVPFFVGRLLSYGFWVMTASMVGGRLNLDSFESSVYLSTYFVLSQLLLVPAIYGFTRVDWHAAFAERRLKFIDRVDLSNGRR